jgi:integrating conjugative element relaxase (TIGR03760 family)
MFALLRRKAARQPAHAPPEPAKGLLEPESSATLLSTPRRRNLLEHIWQRTSLSRTQFAALYLAPIERYASLVQNFPASESHHHAYLGGMLDHGLEIVAYGLKLRQSLLLPIGAPPEAQVAQAEAWTAGVAYAALLHDIGKITVDLHVESADGSVWHPWHGPLQRPYRFRYRKEREYRLHSAATGLLYARLLDREIFDWLSTYPNLWSALLYVLAGQYEHAGALGELVVQADQASVAQELGGDPAKAMAAPRHALQRKLLDGLRYLLKEEFKLNQPQASDGWLTQDALWLVSKTVSDKLRAHLLAQGMDGIPTSNTAVFNVLQDHGIAQATADGKAIWKATVTSDTGWSHTFTFLKISPAMIWEPGERPATFRGTVIVENDACSRHDEMEITRLNSIAVTVANQRHTDPAPPQTSALPESAIDTALSLLSEELLSTQSSPSARTEDVPTSSAITYSQPISAPVSSEQSDTRPEESPGARFMIWLRDAIQTRRLRINDAKALVHTVDGTAFIVSPGVFQRYAQEHPDLARFSHAENLSTWHSAQKQFERLQVHRKQPNGFNIWTCAVSGPRKTRRLHGYLLQEARSLLPAVPFDNPHLKLLAPDATPSLSYPDYSNLARWGAEQQVEK